MEQNKIDIFVAANQGKLTVEHLSLVRSRMASMPDDRLSTLLAVEMKNPTVIWIISFFFGGLGIDRFLVGSIGAGVGKLLTLGGLGLWWFIDLFLIGKKAKESNYSKLVPFL